MGRLILPKTGPVYVDANAAIYRFEGIEPYASASAPLWEAIQEQTMPVVTSMLTLMEVLVKPLRDRDEFLIGVYRHVLLGTKGLECHEIGREILSLAAQVRADRRLKTPDAIHAATAIRAGVAMFLTNDSAFRRVPELNVVILDEVAAS
jgi:predicted nucleic acid-binding protein